MYQFTWFDWFCLWYPPGWLILFNRHWQRYHSDPDGWNWLEYLLFLIPGGFYLALFMRWLRLGCRLPRSQGEQFDPNYQQLFKDEIIAPIVKYYFRAELHQVENLPASGPLIVAMNHAGMCFPWDFLNLGYLLSEQRGWLVQPLADVSLFEHPWLIWWLPPGWAKILGGVRAEWDEFKEAISNQTILLYAPEGLRGPSKGWAKRYQLQTFNLSFIRLSDRSSIPILPVICMGNEYLHTWTFNIKKLARRLQLPFSPISPLMFAFVLFPSMGVWAARSKLHYYIQPVYQTAPITENSPKQERSQSYKQAQELRDKMQDIITQLSR
ncbi:1-acyl-sn-glycerol-3-phosphate acyltransferase [Aliterella atlantica]|uniref:Glycerol acyltransferase n=1 Tax=Aliterella atlantica CENA595 TaxID=1618023 RepID=A0A0D8ZVI0_9CYAN|nr:1-acyl-sn-glycerol-3-phosphate acyltransferase [Aliterella atlantica]KJH72397.1 glycerol acyltransferase [Aliterella atlantica CENA595]